VKADHEQTEVTIRDLYPGLSEDELKEAEENLRRYLEVALEIYRDTERGQGVLDGPLTSLKMEERSNPSLKI
jgi:D-serine dehydratase